MFSAKRIEKKQAFLSAETLCLISPLFLLPLIFWEFSLSTPIPFFITTAAANAAESLFGSVGHSGLIWSLIFLTPEGREWVSADETRTLRRKTILTAAILFTASTAIFFLNNVRITTAFFAIYVSLVLHHSLAQTQGLTFAYSYENSPAEDTRKLIEDLHRRQKVAFQILILLACFLPLDSILKLGALASTAGKCVYFLAGALTCTWLIFSNLRLPTPQKTKMLFLARTFCIPFGAISVFAALGIRLLHSFEYMLIYRKMLSHSGFRSLFKVSTARFVTAGFFMGVTVIWLILFFSSTETRTDYEFSMDKPWWFSLLAGITVTRAMMHFYMDRVVFQMRNPVSRHYWGPMLHGYERAPISVSEKVG